MSPALRGTVPLLVALGLLGACGGGGGDDAPPPAPPGPPAPGGITWTPGSFQASTAFAAQCARPRSGVHPLTGQAWPDRAGSALAEKHWLRSWTNELYLWFTEVPDRDPAATADVLDYFDLLKTPALTATGAPKDRFHFTYPTDTWIQLSQSGSSTSYGAAWELLRGTPPRRLVVAYVEPGSPAAAAGLTRGMEVQTIDGLNFISENSADGVQRLQQAVYPTANGQSHSFVLRAVGGATTSATLTSRTVVPAPVLVSRVLPGNVGYVLFNDHVATAERALVDAIDGLRTAGVTELVLDLRYNGGGLLGIASELAAMIGGTRVAGHVFERQEFNSRYPSTNPVIGGALTPIPFLTRTQGYSIASGATLPTLNLSRVFVLTGEGTCSASESIINGLIGAGVPVIQVGEATCGKPYGFYPTDNCGTTYFSIQFRGVNEAGFGDYADGFAPARTGGDARANLPGCAVADDFTRELGDVTEARLAAALHYQREGRCPVGVAGSQGPRASAAQGDGEGLPIRPSIEPWRQNRILLDPIM